MEFRVLKLAPRITAVALFIPSLFAFNAAMCGLTSGGHLGTLMENVCPLSHTSLWEESDATEEPGNCSRLVAVVERMTIASNKMFRTLAALGFVFLTSAVSILVFSRRTAS